MKTALASVGLLRRTSVPSYLPCFRPNNIHTHLSRRQAAASHRFCKLFILFAFHLRLVELSAVISVISLPFSVNSLGFVRSSVTSPWGAAPLCTYALNLIENFAKISPSSSSSSYSHKRLLSCIIALFIQSNLAFCFNIDTSDNSTTSTVCA